MLDILPIEKDDVSFVETISSVVNKVVSSVQPRDCYILQLDNWFDHKWLLWPGQRPWAEGTVHEKTPLPCFNPSRVVRQLHYVRAAHAPEYTLAPETKIIHGYDGWYPRKTHRWVSDFSDSGVFVWYSGSTASNGQGSLMVYINTKATRSAWYAAFRKKREWAVSACKPISRREIETLIGIAPSTDEG
jgi:hypothetical protein